MPLVHKTIVIHCTCSKVIDEKYKHLFVRQFLISLLTFRYFSVIVSLFGAGAAPFYGSGSGSEQTVSAAPAPAPTKMCRLRPKCVGSDQNVSAPTKMCRLRPKCVGSGSGSEQTVSAVPAPAPAKMCRLRLRLRANRFGGSGSGSDQNVSAPAAPAPHL